MFSLRDLHLVLCSRDLNVVRAQRIIGFFILITHKSMRSENPIIWKSTQVLNFLSTCVSFGHPLAWTCVDFGRAKIRMQVDAKFFTVWKSTQVDRKSSAYV